MKILISVLVLSAVAASGCGVPGLLGTPSSQDEKVVAEFNLVKESKGKIAVLVRGSADTTTMDILGMATTAKLGQLPKMPRGRVISYDNVMRLRVERDRFSAMSPEQVAEAVGADMVFVVKILQYGLYAMPASGYYDSMIVAEAQLVTSGGQQLWPVYQEAKKLQLNAEAQRGTPDQVMMVFLSRTAHGLGRFMYDCPRRHYRMHGEHQDFQWENW